MMACGSMMATRRVTLRSISIIIQYRCFEQYLTRPYSISAMRGVRCAIHLMFQFCCEKYFALAYSAISAINCGIMIEVVGADL